MTNPMLNNMQRPAYELPGLLYKLHDVVAGTKLTIEQAQTVEAADVHADNAADTIVSGLESLGQLLWMAGESSAGLDNRHLGTIGELITHLAVELQHLRGVRAEMEEITRLSKGGAQ